MIREDIEGDLEQARAAAGLIYLLASPDGPPGSPKLRQEFYAYLADNLLAHLESIQVSVENLPPEPELPDLPPPTEREVAGNADITERLRGAAMALRQRNLNRAVELARQASEGVGPLVDHFAELGRRFEPEKPAEQAEGGEP